VTGSAIAAAHGFVYRYAISPVRQHTMVVLHLIDRDGATGIGEAAMAYGETADALPPMLQRLVEAYVLGQDGSRIEAIQHTMLRRSNWGLGGGPVVYGAMAAIDMALHDLTARRLGISVASLLGGPVREEIGLYANGWYGGAVSPEAFADKALATVADGFDALKFDPFRMTADGRMDWPPPVIDDALGRLAVARVAAVRAAIGADVKLLIEFHGGMAPFAATKWGRAIADFRPWFIEEPCPTLSPDPYRVLKRDLSLPIATGERLYLRHQFHPYLAEGLIDVAQPDLGLACGFTETRKIASMADAFGIAVMPHACAGPVLTAASLQFDAATPNALMQEIFPYWADDRAAILLDPPERRISRGRLTLPDGPGLGVTLDQDYADRHCAFRVRAQ
jgi:galactonate dehydratase